MTQYKTIKSYAFPMILISSIILGGLAGHILGPNTQYLKPFGEIFLNLIFTAIVPLIFFSVSSAIARTGALGKLGKIILSMTVVFLFTGIIAAVYALLIVKLFPPGQGVFLHLASPETFSPPSLSSQMVSIFSVPDFINLLSHKNMLALIVFSLLVGLAVATANEKGKKFLIFLQAGEEVFMRVFSLIMYYAPIGFFAYFAVLVSELGPQLMESYLRIAIIYYISSIVYFIVAFSFYAYLAGKIEGIKLFWKNLFLPMVTSIATCSSAASIPANLLATKKMRVSSEIVETVIPLGAIIHKDGSVIGGMFKIAFLFGIFHLDFSGPSVLLIALGVSLLVGTVMGAIPSGGMLGELLILTVYGFPPSVLIAIAAISIIIDPLATMLNVTGNCVAGMMTARLVEGKKWLTTRVA
ncbi:sodium:dicarboxylate symporter protein [Legionella drozanskii LLAP-1]|uniref:Sodium:dicarboxylate symporter protein n=2 Tax=Legionellaceae TaxID=444 RepID=A0A0W0SX46_9GAMM|nr:sodium:dicarboxylate symporter protein [Legionella drozanskii LLAP-1]